MRTSILITSLSIAWSLALGILHVVYARRIAQFYRNHYSSHRFLNSALMSPFRVWVNSRYHETWIRVCGVFAILMGLLVAFVMLRGLLGYGPQ